MTKAKSVKVKKIKPPTTAELVKFMSETITVIQNMDSAIKWQAMKIAEVDAKAGVLRDSISTIFEKLNTPTTDKRVGSG